MNTEKKLEREQRINKKLKEELSKVKLENNDLIDKCLEPDIQVTELIKNLSEINESWSNALEEIQKERDEYKRLNQELREFRNQMIGSSRLQRWVNKKLG